ncbi:hypothetical protein AB0M95_00355 [Sphaerisporangium sp. NPDC051017]|uniref:hypothetical protein n=1 Tax=Sphaerisporangium sp. NPDC051017 TaxID=3154636 RepID=UPI00344A668D
MGSTNGSGTGSGVARYSGANSGHPEPPAPTETPEVPRWTIPNRRGAPTQDLWAASWTISTPGSGTTPGEANGRPVLELIQNALPAALDRIPEEGWADPGSLSHRLAEKTASMDAHDSTSADRTSPAALARAPAALTIIELIGPCRFSHFGENGLPVGKAMALPLIQIAATPRFQARAGLGAKTRTAPRVSHSILG